jgi:hypothetical protein
MPDSRNTLEFIKLITSVIEPYGFNLGDPIGVVELFGSLQVFRKSSREERLAILTTEPFGNSSLYGPLVLPMATLLIWSFVVRGKNYLGRAVRCELLNAGPFWPEGNIPNDMGWPPD